MTRRTTGRALTAAAAGVMLVAVANAAVDVSAQPERVEGDATVPSRPAVSRLGAAGAGDLAGGGDDSATIRMLLELQQQGDGLENGDRQRRIAVRANRAAARAAAEQLGGAAGVQTRPPGGAAATATRGAADPASPNSLDLGAGETASLSKTAMTWAQPGLGTSRAAQLHAAGAEADEEAVRSLIPAPLLRWLRENRELIMLASVVLVALIAVSGAAKKR